METRNSEKRKKIKELLIKREMLPCYNGDTNLFQRYDGTLVLYVGCTNEELSGLRKEQNPIDPALLTDPAFNSGELKIAIGDSS